MTDHDDEYYMRQALREARQAADEDEVPIGAVIVAGGDIVARAHNQTERLHDVTAHAEMLAFTAAADAILRAAGGRVLRISDGKPLEYGKKEYPNPPFVAWAGIALCE